MSSGMDLLQQGFFLEAEELINQIESTLLALETTPQDQELLNAGFRCVLSIKGAAGVLGFTEVSQFAGHFENVLNLLRHQQIVATPPVISLLLQASHVLKSWMSELKGEGSVDSACLGAVTTKLKHILTAHLAEFAGTLALDHIMATPLVPDTLIYEIYLEPPSDIFQKGQDPLHIIEELGRLGEVLEVNANLSHLPSLAAMDPQRCYLGWTIRLRSTHTTDALQVPFQRLWVGGVHCITQITSSRSDTLQAEIEGDLVVRRERLLQTHQLNTPVAGEEIVGAPLIDGLGSTAELPHTSQAKQPERQHQQEASSMRVNTDKVDKLINVVGELIIKQSIVARLVSEFTLDRLPQLKEAIAQLGYQTRELQDQVMAIRMLPIRTVFSRFRRVVRDLATSQGKQVILETIGEGTELDRMLIEQIGDPLTHLVRNAMDHGIECPAARRRAGKPTTGRLTLKAYQQGGNVYIEVSDDGEGLDRDRIIGKATQKGLTAPNRVLTDEEIFALIFHPGLSTAETITEVSGRGVGMDVVKQSVETLGGSITVQSEWGHGTTFKIKLPSTLSMLDGQLIRIGTEIYIIPVLSIIETVQPKGNNLNEVFGATEAITFRGEVLPILRLDRLLAVKTSTEDATQGLVMIVKHDTSQIALFVDGVLGQEQVVFKSLEANFKNVEGLAGTTMLRDGRVALILDIAGLVRLASARGGDWQAP